MDIGPVQTFAQHMKRKDFPYLSNSLGVSSIPFVLLAQTVIKQSAPKIYSTPLCKKCYQFLSKWDEQRREMLRNILISEKNNKNNSEKFIFHNASTAFVDRIRAPPAEI